MANNITEIDERLPEKQIELRELSPNDTAIIAKVHLNAFPNSTWTKLGRLVVERYYEWQFAEHHPFVSAKGAFQGGRLFGICFSGVFSGSTSGFVGKYRNLLILSALMRPWLILSSKFRRGLGLRKKLIKNYDTGQHLERRKVSSYGVLSIAVMSRARGMGLGKTLLADAEKTARRKGFERMHLTVDVANVAAIALYEKLGWERILVDGVWRGMMAKNLDSAETCRREFPSESNE